MVWLIAFLPAPTSQLLPAAAHNQFLNIHSARLDFAASVARVSAYTWQCQCQVDMSSRVISWAQIPGHVQWEIFGPTAWGEHCLSCPVVKYWVHLCSGKLKTASGHDNWQVASDIWHLTSGIWHLANWRLHLATTIDKWDTTQRDNAANLVLTPKDYIESASVPVNLANLFLTRL